MTYHIFHDVEADTSNLQRMAGFAVSVNCTQDQLISSGGISFDLDIKYVGEEEVAIHNPLYFLQILVMDEKGFPLELKKKPPIPLVHQKTPVNPDEDFVFAITGIFCNDSEANISGETNKSVVLFDKGFRFTYSIRIEKYLDPDTDKLRNFPKGEYRLDLMLSLVALDTTDAAVGAESRTLKITDLGVALKEQTLVK